jgi:alpha-1,6-mannosyltransferase
MVYPGYEKDLDHLIAELGLRNAVTRTGHVSDVVPLIGALDVLVNASDEDRFGLVLLEAMSHDVPVVAVASGARLEILEKGRFGALAAYSESADLVCAIEPLLRDPDSRMSQTGRRRIEDAFAADAAARRVEDSLLSVRGDQAT